MGLGTAQAGESVLVPDVDVSSTAGPTSASISTTVASPTVALASASSTATVIATIAATVAATSSTTAALSATASSKRRFHVSKIDINDLLLLFRAFASSFLAFTEPGHKVAFFILGGGNRLGVLPFLLALGTLIGLADFQGVSTKLLLLLLLFGKVVCIAAGVILRLHFLDFGDLSGSVTTGGSCAVGEVSGWSTSTVPAFGASGSTSAIPAFSASSSTSTIPSTGSTFVFFIIFSNGGACKLVG